MTTPFDAIDAATVDPQIVIDHVSLVRWPRFAWVVTIGTVSVEFVLDPSTEQGQVPDGMFAESYIVRPHGSRATVYEEGMLAVRRNFVSARDVLGAACKILSTWFKKVAGDG